MVTGVEALVHLNSCNQSQVKVLGLVAVPVVGGTSSSSASYQASIDASLIIKRPWHSMGSDMNRTVGIDSTSLHGSLQGLSSRRDMTFDISSSIHIHPNDHLKSSSLREPSSILTEASIASDRNDIADAARAACIKAKKNFERDLSNSRIKDVSHTFPAFLENEVLIGRSLGRGVTGEVSQVLGFRHRREVGGDVTNCAAKMDEEARAFIVKHCYRDSGDARYAIKRLRKGTIEDPLLLFNGIADLNVETRLLAHLTMNPHPNVSMLRAMSGGDRFSPDFFIVIDRLYDTLETRLDKWMDKAQTLISPVGGKRLRSLLLGSKRGLAPKDNLHGERSMLLDDQLRALYELSSAIAHMHEHKIMHRDLKPTNLAFDIQDDIKVFDLALGKEIPMTTGITTSSDTAIDGGKMPLRAWKFTQMVGTPRYMAPEVALGWAYNEKCDVFSFGILMWQIMSLQTKPYGCTASMNSLEFFNRSVWQGQMIRPSMQFKNRTVQEHFSPQLQELVESCWSHRWQDRPLMREVERTMSQLFVHQFKNCSERGHTSSSGSVRDKSFGDDLQTGTSPPPCSAGASSSSSFSFHSGFRCRQRYRDHGSNP